MKEITIKNADLVKAAEEGMDDFLQVFIDAINNSIGGELNGATMAELNSEQITLMGYAILRDEVMDGGFIQLIHNGYGPFFFQNPFRKAMRLWGIDELATLMNKVNSQYSKNRQELERDCDDETFMALYEQYPKYDAFDDEFVENEERWTAQVAYYVDEHIENFAKIVDQ